MGLKGMGRIKAPTEDERERQRKEFIAGAALQAAPVEEVKSTAKRKRKSPVKRIIFSLTDDVDTQIEKLSLVPRTFKATRSDVVRAGIVALQAMSKAEITALLAQVCGADQLEDDSD